MEVSLCSTWVGYDPPERLFKIPLKDLLLKYNPLVQPPVNTTLTPLRFIFRLSYSDEKNLMYLLETPSIDLQVANKTYIMYLCTCLKYCKLSIQGLWKVRSKIST